ncbi:hypothetical protein [Albibacterium indicum]|nr:hypothetical protein [Pedobacter indicus]
MRCYYAFWTVFVQENLSSYTRYGERVDGLDNRCGIACWLVLLVDLA